MYTIMKKLNKKTCAKEYASLFVDFGPFSCLLIEFSAMCMKFGRYFIVKIVSSATFFEFNFICGLLELSLAKPRQILPTSVHLT